MINTFMRALVLAMQARGIDRPLLQYVRVCDLWRELALMTGAPVPADVEAAAQEHPFAGLAPPAPAPKEEG